MNSIAIAAAISLLAAATLRADIGSELTPGPVLGINGDAEWCKVEDQPALMAKYQASNTKFVRIGADWGVFQPKSAGAYPTGFNPTYVARMDNFFKLCQDNGIRVLLIAAYAPPWAALNGNKTPGSAPAPEHYADYAAYCCWLLQRYSPYKDASGHRTLEAMELWNEPDLCDLFFRGYKREEPAAGTAYGQIVVAAGSALKTLRASLGVDVPICAPVVSDAHSVSYAPKGQTAWIDAFYAVPGVTSDYDIFTWHAYWNSSGSKGWNSPELSRAWNPALQSQAVLGKILATQIWSAPLWPKMQAAGDTAKPIWCTETGVAAESNVAETPPHSKGQLLLTEEPAMFADEVNTLLDSNQADPAQNNIPNFRRIYWFRLTEYDTYGILDKAGQPKLIYTSYQKEAKSGALDHLARVEDGGFEAKPSAPSAAGTPWTFDGACTVVRITPTVPPSAADAPEGFQVASLAGATASAAQSLYFPAGNYVINFQAAMVAGHPVNPIQVSVDGANVGAPLPPAGTAFGQMTSAPFTIATAGPHTIKLAGTADPAETYLDDVQVAPVP